MTNFLVSDERVRYMSPRAVEPRLRDVRLSRRDQRQARSHTRRAEPAGARSSRRGGARSSSTKVYLPATHRCGPWARQAGGVAMTTVVVLVVRPPFARRIGRTRRT